MPKCKKLSVNEERRVERKVEKKREQLERDWLLDGDDAVRLRNEYMKRRHI